MTNLCLVSIAALAAMLAACGGGVPQASAPMASSQAPAYKMPVSAATFKPGGPTLYVMNENGVTIFSHGGGTFLRTIGSPSQALTGMAVDPVGHLYIRNASAIRVYGNRGATLLQTVVSYRHFDTILLGRSSTLYTICNGKVVYEYGVGIDGRLTHIIRKILLTKYNIYPSYLALDKAGNIAVSGGPVIGSSGGTAVFAPGQTRPYWTISGYANGLAFDAFGYLYVAANGTGVNVYPPRSTSPTRTITNGVGPYVAGLAFDSPGNLYLLNYGPARSCPQSSVTEYAPGGNAPTRTLTQGLTCLAEGLAIDSAKNVYVAQLIGGGSSGEVVVYGALGGAPKRIIAQNVPRPLAVAIGP